MSFGILGQVWYLIVSIPDLCNLITLIAMENTCLPFHYLIFFLCEIDKPFLL